MEEWAKGVGETEAKGARLCLEAEGFRIPREQALGLDPRGTFIFNPQRPLTPTVGPEHLGVDHDPFRTSTLLRKTRAWLPHPTPKPLGTVPLRLSLPPILSEAATFIECPVPSISGATPQFFNFRKCATSWTSTHLEL